MVRSGRVLQRSEDSQEHHAAASVPQRDAASIGPSLSCAADLRLATRQAVDGYERLWAKGVDSYILANANQESQATDLQDKVESAEPRAHQGYNFRPAFAKNEVRKKL